MRTFVPVLCQVTNAFLVCSGQKIAEIAETGDQAKTRKRLVLPDGIMAQTPPGSESDPGTGGFGTFQGCRS
jgi:hypothetical protein